MKLYDYLKKTEIGEEITVWDAEYDMEIYFYNAKSTDDKWDKAMMKIAKVLNITKIYNSGVEVDLSKIIEKNIKKLISVGLFPNDTTLDGIMVNIDKIFAGYVSEKWFVEFADTLSE